MAIVEEEFEGPAQTVTVTPAGTQTANLTVKYKQVTAQGAGAAGAAAQSNYGATRVSADGTVVELLDFDQLYPPSPARDVMVKECFTCHGPTGWHRSGPRSEAQWRRAVQRMFDADGRVAGMNAGVPQTTYDHVPKEQVEQIIKYLTANFGPGSKPRDLKTDPLVRDEEALGQAIYVQYRSAAADPCAVQADRHLRRSADAIAAFGLGQRRESWRRLHVGQPFRVDRRRRHPRCSTR